MVVFVLKEKRLNFQKYNIICVRHYNILLNQKLKLMVEILRYIIFSNMLEYMIYPGPQPSLKLLVELIL